jgi:transposase/DNA-binding transcriptional MerR regulator
VLSPTEREQLQSYTRSRALPHALVRRAKIVLWSAMGDSNTAIAERLQVSQPTVSLWRRRFLERGLAGLYAERPAGHARSYDEEQVARLMQRALSSRPKQGTHWSVRSFAKASGVSKSTVQRYFSLFGIQPHRRNSFKLSNDPFFVEKVRDIVGLYLNPPENALVLCVDEKSQVQALERSQPILPMGLGYVEGVTHDYFRHGTTTLFAALDIANGSVIGQCKRRHRHQEFLAFLRHVERNVPAGLDIHLIVDNYSTHKHAKVRAWFAKRPRFHLHFTPTYASWLNQVERWFGLITQQAIRRGSFQSVHDLVGHIERYIERHNQHPCPFMWTASAESILAKVERISKLISGTAH